MDYFPQDLPKSAYEYIVDHSVDSIDNQSIKNEAFRMMDQLEGWCSKKKAGILIDLICAAKPKVIVEIGIYGGKSFIPMAYALKMLGNGGVAIGIDPWKSSISAEGMEDVNLEWWSNLDHDKIKKGFLRKLYEFNLKKCTRVIQTTSREADPIPNIDFIHIDGNHSEDSAYLDVTKWVPLVRTGGIIIFDDVDWPVTAKAVEWLNANCEQVGLVRDTNIWGVWIKI